MSRKIQSHLTLAVLIVALGPAGLHSQTPAGSFTMEQVKSYPFPNELTASSSGSRLAWALNERGMRNVWVAEGPAFTPRRLTNYTSDDGQELTSILITQDGNNVVYVRGGDHGGNWDESVAVNPTENPGGFKVQVWSVPFSGGEPKALAEGDEPAVSPRGDRVAFTKNHEIWISPIDGATAAKKLVSARGNLGDLAWRRAGLPMENELPSCERLAEAAHRTRCSSSATYRGRSGLLMQRPVRAHYCGKRQKLLAAPIRRLRAKRICTGPPTVGSYFYPTSTAGRISTRSQKAVVHHCC